MPTNDTHTPVLDHGFTVDEVPGYPGNGTKINGRPDDPFNDQCPVDEVQRKYRDQATTEGASE